MMQTSHSRIGASGSACQGADLVSVFASTEAMLPKWLHTGVILPVVTSPFAYFDTELNVSSACFAGTAADINTVTLQDAESLLWNVRRSFASSILCLVGATAALKVGVVQAVATDNGHVSVQCLASTRLLFPPSLDGLDKDFAFNSNAAGGQSTPLGADSCLTQRHRSLGAIASGATGTGQLQSDSGLLAIPQASPHICPRLTPDPSQAALRSQLQLRGLGLSNQGCR
ncbi:hypothetical protein WJX79_010382 [Trebouxia sp. C0005]